MAKYQYTHEEFWSAVLNKVNHVPQFAGDYFRLTLPKSAINESGFEVNLVFRAKYFHMPLNAPPVLRWKYENHEVIQLKK